MLYNTKHGWQKVYFHIKSSIEVADTAEFLKLIHVSEIEKRCKSLEIILLYVIDLLWICYLTFNQTQTSFPHRTANEKYRKTVYVYICWWNYLLYYANFCKIFCFKVFFWSILFSKILFFTVKSCWVAVNVVNLKLWQRNEMYWIPKRNFRYVTTRVFCLYLNTLHRLQSSVVVILPNQSTEIAKFDLY